MKWNEMKKVIFLNYPRCVVVAVVAAVRFDDIRRRTQGIGEAWFAAEAVRVLLAKVPPILPQHGWGKKRHQTSDVDGHFWGIFLLRNKKSNYSTKFKIELGV